MTARLVVVVGAGVAGTAAAWAAARAGAKVSVVSRGAGASSLMSGAVDRVAWHPGRELSPDPVDTNEAAFLDAIGLWDVPGRTLRLASLAGVIRPAMGADRALLDLDPMNDTRVAVPRLARPSWDAELLARSLTADGWARSRRVVFEPVECELFGDQERFGSDEQLAAMLDDEGVQERCAKRLGACSEGYGAVLTGPWLGIETAAGAALRRALGKPVGETLSQLAASAGARFERASQRVLSGIDCVTARVTRLARGASRWEVHHDASAEPIAADAIVIASGGLVGGGIVYAPSESLPCREIPAGSSEPFALSFESPARMAIDQRPMDHAGSLFGPNLESLGWPQVSEQRAVFERVGVLHRAAAAMDRSGTALEGLFVAGSAAGGAEHTVLGAIRSGLQAAAAACA